VSVTVKTTDEQGWSIVKTFSIELVNVTAVESANLVFSVYPSKTSAKVYIDGPVSPQTEVVIYTMEGKILMKTSVEDRSMIDMSFAPRGVYVAIIRNKGFRYHFRIIKE
jgi:hypothetical protein